VSELRYASLAGKVVLVTGGGRGIGRAIALAFGEQGSQVIVNDVALEGATETVEAIKESAGCAEAAIADVGEPTTAEAMVAGVVERYGRLDVLVNNAGINPVVPLLEAGQGTWEQAHRVNEWALFYYGQPACRQMVSQGGGCIVVIGSPAVVDAYAGQSLYCASKAGLQMLAMSMAWEWGPLGVRTNVVQPGWIETELNREYLWSGSGVRERVIDVIPLRRTGLPADIAATVLWLCSEDASYVNGATIAVDGGLLAGRPKT
jgi:NAD(P)-dependent dehydrogenase (short-subunit alcohol dehydrogenase family)